MDTHPCLGVWTLVLLMLRVKAHLQICIALCAETACAPFLLFVKFASSNTYAGVIHAYSSVLLLNGLACPDKGIKF